MGYINVDYIGDLERRRFMIGFVFTFSGGLICWRSVLQSIVVISITKAEYMQMTKATKEALWLNGLIGQSSFKQDSLCLHCDSQSIVHMEMN